LVAAGVVLVILHQEQVEHLVARAVEVATQTKAAVRVLPDKVMLVPEVH
jgi:hypothetical protein